MQDVPSGKSGHGTLGDFDTHCRTSQATLLGVIDNLGERLQSLVKNKSIGNDHERLRLQEDLDMSKKCLQVCKVASEISYQKIQRIGEAVAEDSSDQVVVTTSADLFDLKVALSKGHSAQLVGILTPENFNYMADKRYDGRSGVSLDHSVQSQSSISSSQRDKQSITPRVGRDGRSMGSEARRDKPNSNEVRKRHGDDETGRQAKPFKE